MSTLVIDTRPPAPRKVGGGLDDPTPTPSGRARNHRRTGPARTAANRTTTGTRTTPTSAGQPAPLAAPADSPADHDDRTPSGHPEPAPPDTLPPAPASGAAHVTGRTAVEELASVRAVLGPLVPTGDTASTLRLAQAVAAKLAGHGPHCAIAIHPPRGSLTVDEGRARCRAILDAFDPVERHALLALITHDVRAASR